uniref:Uncharacterized protein n=1 Tax=Tanacetum cinerariifolium TaxID=118510 RepID=A0A699IST6_TANCI|nr:hypothetical protein [Tanacetum cinerariifolium]
MKRNVTTFEPGFNDLKWKLSTLNFTFGGHNVYSVGDILNCAFLASRLYSSALQTKLLQNTGIIDYGPTFDDDLCMFNTTMETEILSNLSEIAALNSLKKLTNIYFTGFTKTVKSNFSSSLRKMELRKSKMGDHTSDWLRVVLICGLVHAMNDKIYPSVLCYRLGYVFIAEGIQKFLTGQDIEAHVAIHIHNSSFAIVK